MSRSDESAPGLRPGPHTGSRANAKGWCALHTTLTVFFRRFLIVPVVTACFLSIPVAATAAVIQLTCGDPKADGNFRFTLDAPDGESIDVNALNILETDDAVDKATKLATLVNGIPGGKWRALRDGAKLTFQHLENGEWKDVGKGSQIEDTTAEEEKWEAISGAGGLFDFRLLPGITSGAGAGGGPDVVTCATTGGSAAVNVVAGMQASLVVDQLFADLQADGVTIQRLEPTAFRITDLAPAAFIQYQCTDTGIHVQGGRVAVLGVPVPGVSGPLLMALMTLLAASGSRAVWLRKPRRSMAAGLSS